MGTSSDRAFDGYSSADFGSIAQGQPLHDFSNETLPQNDSEAPEVRGSMVDDGVPSIALSKGMQDIVVSTSTDWCPGSSRTQIILKEGRLGRDRNNELEGNRSLE